MTEQNNHGRLVILSIIVLNILFFLLLYRISLPFYLRFLPIVFFLFLSKDIKTLKLSSIDISILLIFVYDLLLWILNIDFIQSSISFQNSLLCYSFYLIFRVLFINKRSIILFQNISLIPLIIWILLSIITFAVFVKSTKQNFPEIYSFRFLYKPLGYTTNIWVTILIALIGYLVIGFNIQKYKSKRFIYYFILIFSFFCVLISFSRAAYLIVILGIIFSIIVLRIRNIRLLFPFLFIILFTLYLFPSETNTTLQMNKTISQKKSLDSRVNSTFSSLQFLNSDKLLFGSGVGNYTLAVDKEINQDSTQRFTTFPPNIIVEILKERGIVGLLLFLLLLWVLILNTYRSRHFKICILIGIILLLLYIKELTLGIVLSTPVLIILCAFFLSVLHRYRLKTFFTFDNTIFFKNLFFSAFIILFAISQLLIMLHNKDEDYNLKSIESLSKKNYNESIYYLKKTGSSLPFQINKLNLYMTCFKYTHDTIYLQSAEKELPGILYYSDQDIQIRFLYSKFLSLNNEDTKALEILTDLTEAYPKNSSFKLELFRILYISGDKIRAANHLVGAIRFSPSILFMDFIKKIKNEDIAFYTNISKDLMDESSFDINDPLDLARYGFISYYYENYEIAEDRLKRALNGLPNLSTPWYLLSNIEKKRNNKENYRNYLSKYLLIVRGPYQHFERIENYEISEDLLFQSNDVWDTYSLKFKKWYKSQFLVPEL
ncbi:MAG: O-antigen ligase family protein [Tissierellia bacterium]|nr:O-antigen ligase family protein [Tissierellia bacterium]